MLALSLKCSGSEDVQIDTHVVLIVHVKHMHINNLPMHDLSSAHSLQFDSATAYEYLNHHF